MVRNLSIGHLRAFGCVACEHISNGCRKKLDAKSHACIMMVYFEESRACRLFDLVKQQIIIKKNMIFDENNLGFGLLKSSSIFSYNDPF